MKLPAFVEQEFRDFLTCGVLAHGFACVRRDTCAFERLVPFSCKGRGFCPSCGGRRMTEHAARLPTEVLPQVPVRQWVLSLPIGCGTCWRGTTSCVGRGSVSSRGPCSTSIDARPWSADSVTATRAP